jgi:hypothetical protein
MHHSIFDQDPEGTFIPLAMFIAALGLLWWKFDWAVALAVGLLVLAIVLFIADYTRKIVIAVADISVEKINGRG